jgi:hypothetical protein
MDLWSMTLGRVSAERGETILVTIEPEGEGRVEQFFLDVEDAKDLIQVLIGAVGELEGRQSAPSLANAPIEFSEKTSGEGDVNAVLAHLATAQPEYDLGDWALVRAPEND